VARFGAVDQTVLAQYDLLDVGGIGHYGEGDIARGSDFGRCAFAECARDQHRLESIKAPPVYDEFMSGAHQVFRHGTAHDAAAYKAYIHIFTLLLCLV